MMLLTDLPLHLLLFISEYLVDGRESSSWFASVNRNLSRELLKKVRRIRILASSQKWKSDEKRSRLLQMIDNPSHQLSFCDDCHSLTDISPSLFSLIGVNGLEISGSEIPILMNHVKAKQFMIKSLDIDDVDVLPLDCLPNVESLSLSLRSTDRIEALHLPAYKFLRSLVLTDCDMLEDVSCLDGIHDLLLYCCPKIRDISSLNNNYRVCISQCEGIVTYSKSFHSSRSVWIERNSSEVLVSLENCHSLTSLSISAKSFTLSDNCLNSLRYLSLSHIRNFKALPPNRLQKAEIINCDDFESLENMDNIRSINLTSLKITSLSGLGAKNQIVSLNELHGLTDIDALKDSTIVKVNNCPLIQEKICSSLLHVRELSICYSSKDISISLRRLRQLQEMKDLKELRFQVRYPTQACYEEIKSLIFILHRVEKFVLSGDLYDMVGEEFNEEFFVTRKKLFIREVVFLRKIRE